MKEFFTSNREALVTKLNGGIVVLSAYTAMQRSNDTTFLFEQEANFWWLTGIDMPDWWLIIDGSRRKSWLVSPSVKEIHEIFDGTLSEDEAIRISGVDGVIMHDEAMTLLRTLAKKHSVAYTLGEHPYVEYFNFMQNPAPKKMHDQLDRTFTSVQDCRKELAQLRAIKQPYEIQCMKKAINLTLDAFEIVKSKLSSFQYEYEIEAEFTYHFRRNGARNHAYDPIVASGKNACTMHYYQNDSKLKKRELLLMDVGARHFGYAADISRTYALGEPTKRQKEVHQAVQHAHNKIIQLFEPGLPIQEYLKESDAIMATTLVEIGLVDDHNNTKEVRRYFPHAISHGLGVDCHDSLGSPRTLQAGMVLTVEPGIYIPEEGIGVRLEDNILVTDAGYTNLSARLSTDL